MHYDAELKYKRRTPFPFIFYSCTMKCSLEMYFDIFEIPRGILQNKIIFVLSTSGVDFKKEDELKRCSLLLVFPPLSLLFSLIL